MAPWLILLLGLLVLVALVAIYPFKALVERISSARRSDPLTIAYVRNLLRADPENVELQRAWKLLTSAQQDPAADAGSVDVDRQAWQKLLDRESAVRLMAAGSPVQVSLLAELRRDLYALAERPLPESLQIELARKARYYREDALAERIFERLARERTDVDAAWFGEAAALALAEGDYRSAARLYRIARARAATPVEQRKYFIDALRALRNGNLMAEAVELAEAELGALERDRETLLYLVELFRAANRPDLAEKYVHAMLRLSLLETLSVPLAGLDAHFSPGGFRRVGEMEPAVEELPLNERIYQTSYDVFLANRKLEDAWRLANNAVRRWPDSAAWRERLARVSEWTGRPQIALEQWWHLARQRGDDESWAGVLRLAPGLMNDEALLGAQRWQLARNPGDRKLIMAIADALERLGRPREALALLREQQARQPGPDFLEAAGRVAERVGDSETAIRLLREANRQQGYTGERASRLATLLLLANRRGEALAELRAARPAVADGDETFWRLLAEVARTQQEDDEAAAAFQKLVGRDRGAEYDYAALSLLLRDSLPLESARVAEEGWKRHRKPYLLVSSLSLYASQGRWQDMGRVFAALRREDLAALEGETEFLRLRALYLQSTARHLAARRDLERALAIDPEARRLREALLWLLVDSYDGAALRHLLGRVEPVWATDPDLHDALASAHLALSQPRDALRYLAPQAKRRQGDFLWMMTYADTLEQNGEADRAWRLREVIWRQAPWRQHSSPADQAVTDARRAARHRLVMTRRPGDAGMAVMRSLLRADRSGSAPLDPMEKELVLAWWQGAGEYSAERAWLWSRYARHLAHPLWARVAVALSDDNREELARLLERYAERMPRYDRVTAAQRTGEHRAAQSFAFDALERQPHDDLSHQQMVETVLEHAHRAGAGFVSREVGVLSERGREVSLDWTLRPGLSLGLAGGEIGRSSSDAAVIRNIPSTEGWAQASLTWRDERQTLQLAAGTREGVTDYSPLSLSLTRRLIGNASVGLTLGHHNAAPESAALRVAGLRDHASLALGLPLTSHDRVTLDLGAQRYRTQYGDPLGSGQRLGLDLTHAVRIEQPDLHLSAFALHYRFSTRDGAVDPRLQALAPEGTGVDTAFFMPRGYRLYGLRASTGVGHRETYTRALRPFLATSLYHNSVTGEGWGMSMGLSGSVLGNDHLSLGWLYDRGGSSAYDRTREFGLRYRLYF